MNTSDSYNGSTRSDHCPLLRSGPALGCSFCWNTIDARGRFLRRKTKYHCPECNINLCLVPCFQVIICKKKIHFRLIFTIYVAISKLVLKNNY